MTRLATLLLLPALAAVLAGCGGTVTAGGTSTSGVAGASTSSTGMAATTTTATDTQSGCAHAQAAASGTAQRIRTDLRAVVRSTSIDQFQSRLANLRQAVQNGRAQLSASGSLSASAQNQVERLRSALQTMNAAFGRIAKDVQDGNLAQAASDLPTNAVSTFSNATSKLGSICSG